MVAIEQHSDEAAAAMKRQDSLIRTPSPKTQADAKSDMDPAHTSLPYRLQPRSPMTPTSMLSVTSSTSTDALDHLREHTGQPPRKRSRMTPPDDEPEVAKAAANKTPLPAHLLKHFKLTPAARANMENFEGDRVCPLDKTSDKHVLVYDARHSKHTIVGNSQSETASTESSAHQAHQCWSQRSLAEAARQNAKLRIARKAIQGSDVEIFQADLFQGRELEAYRTLPNMGCSLARLQIGHFAALRHDFIYILSSKV